MFSFTSATSETSNGNWIALHLFCIFRNYYEVVTEKVHYWNSDILPCAVLKKKIVLLLRKTIGTELIFSAIIVFPS